MITKNKITLFLWTILINFNLFTMEERENNYLMEYKPMKKNGEIQCHLYLPTTSYNPMAENNEEIFVTPWQRIDLKPMDSMEQNPDFIDQQKIIKAIKETENKTWNPDYAIYWRRKISQYVFSTIPQPSIEDVEQIKNQREYYFKGATISHPPEDFLGSIMDEWNYFNTKKCMKIPCQMIHETSSYGQFAKNQKNPKEEAFYYSSSTKYNFSCESYPSSVLDHNEKYVKTPLPSFYVPRTR
jgi:hypothetical protein